MTAAGRFVIDGLRELLADERARGELLALLADVVPAPADAVADGWMTTGQAAEYLGITKDALYKLTSARRVPFEQDCEGGRCFFKRSELDAWRRSGGAAARR